MSKNPIVSMYHLLRQNRMTFKAIILLKEHGVNRRMQPMGVRRYYMQLYK